MYSKTTAVTCWLSLSIKIAALVSKLHLPLFFGGDLTLTLTDSQTVSDKKRQCPAFRSREEISHTQSRPGSTTAEVDTFENVTRNGRIAEQPTTALDGRFALRVPSANFDTQWLPRATKCPSAGEDGAHL